MKIKPWLVISFPLLLLSAVAAFAQQPPMVQANPTPGCTATPAQLEAPREARVALADPSYKQHNPAFKKRAEETHVSDYEEFKTTFLAQAAGRVGASRGAASGPQSPPGNPLEVATAECDIVTAIHKVYRQDPTAEPSKFYEAFTFDTFRVRNGKLVEHWDGALIAAPAARASEFVHSSSTLAQLARLPALSAYNSD